MKTLAISAVLLVTLIGCTSISDVVKVGKDTYMVGTSVHGGLTSDTEVKAGAIKRAQQYCGAMNKDMEMVSSQSSGTQGWTPQNAEVVFHCE